MSTETYTPAVQRAADLLIHEAETTGLITEDVRNGLAAALDVEEMARAVADDLYGQDVHTLVMRRPGESYRGQAERIGQWAAETVHAAILGTDSKGGQG